MSLRLETVPQLNANDLVPAWSTASGTTNHSGTNREIRFAPLNQQSFFRLRLP
jgi:hypothetical protein